MEIENKEPPSEEAVKRYKDKLEELLKPLNVEVDVVIRDVPLRIKGWTNNKIIEHYNSWLKNILISTPDIKELEIDHLWTRKSIGEEEPAEKLWLDAYLIQRTLYNAIGKDPGHPELKDPYWELWSKRNKK